MNVYHYHPETFEYVGTTEADVSPLEPDVFLIPAHATEIPPPATQQGFARVWQNGEWVQIEDHRGERWWDEAGQLVPIFFIGDPEDRGLTNIEPPPPPPPTDYTLAADLPWSRMTEDEAELVQGGIDAAPVKTRNMINKATSFSTGTDAFSKFKAIIAAAAGAERAEEIMSYPSDIALDVEESV